jgi:hypothetical protein
LLGCDPRFFIFGKVTPTLRSFIKKLGSEKRRISSQNYKLVVVVISKYEENAVFDFYENILGKAVETNYTLDLD